MRLQLGRHLRPIPCCTSVHIHPSGSRGARSARGPTVGNAGFAEELADIEEPYELNASETGPEDDEDDDIEPEEMPHPIEPEEMPHPIEPEEMPHP